MKYNTQVFQLEDNLNVLKNIRNDCLNSGMRYGWKANNEKAYDQGHWNRQYLTNSQMLPYDHGRMPYIDKFQNIKTIWNSIQAVIGQKNLLRCYVNGYTFGTDGYAHVDDNWILRDYGTEANSQTIIVYLNDTWDIDWAGETVIFDDNKDIELAVLPKFGKVLAFDSSKLHAARPLSRYCAVLRSVLVFKTMPDIVLSKEVDFVRSKTADASHSGRTFFEHLYNTMRNLESNKANKELCLAGLFHAVYGTDFYNFNDDSINRDIIKSLIGEYSERLVYEFCTLKDRTNSLINNTTNLEDTFRKDLIKIEIANLKDQNQKGNLTATINNLENIIK
jgi:hypothetical protein